jgi:hypothetical protein
MKRQGPNRYTVRHRNGTSTNYPDRISAEAQLGRLAGLIQAEMETDAGVWRATTRRPGDAPHVYIHSHPGPWTPASYSTASTSPDPCDLFSIVAVMQEIDASWSVDEIEINEPEPTNKLHEPATFANLCRRAVSLNDDRPCMRPIGHPGPHSATAEIPGVYPEDKDLDRDYR